MKTLFITTTLVILLSTVSVAQASKLYWCAGSGSWITNPADCLSCNPH